MIKFEFGPPRPDSDHMNKRDPLDVLIRVVSDVRIEVNGQPILAEPEFPIVEFAAQLDHWLRQRDRREFTYESAESEDAPLWFRLVHGRWHIGSDLGSRSEQEVDPGAVETFAKDYVDQVRQRVRSALGLDVTRAFRSVK